MGGEFVAVAVEFYGLFVLGVVEEGVGDADVGGGVSSLGLLMVCWGESGLTLGDRGV